MSTKFDNIVLMGQIQRAAREHGLHAALSLCIDCDVPLTQAHAILLPFCSRSAIAEHAARASVLSQDSVLPALH